MKTLAEYVEMLRGAVLYPTPGMRVVHICAVVILLVWVFA